jgi:hypothetical protein
MKIDITTLDDTQKHQLVSNRWESSKTVWETVDRVYKANTRIYENKADWLDSLPYQNKGKIVQANRIFTNMEAVINSLIAQQPGLNILPARDGEEAQDYARKLESFMQKKFLDLNTKEVARKGLRNLYFGRLIVIKAFWNPAIDDFDYRAVDPRKVRFGKYASKEQDSEFAIEEIDDNLCAVIERFPEKKTELMKKFGITTEADLYVKNPDITYKESWIQNYVVFSHDTIILGCIKNPYWDWDGILVTEDEETELNKTEKEGSLNVEQRRQKLQTIKLEQDSRKAAMQAATETPEGEDKGEADDGSEDYETEEVNEPPKYKAYYFNYFDEPRKPYIFATIFNNENSPIGRTDMITLSASLQQGIDKRKMDIGENCELANGIIKVDAEVMGKADAQRIRFETRGVIWGKGVVNGVQRETGTALPQMVFDDMIDSRSEIDNIMAATSAFRGERQGQETKAGRLALIQQSFLRLNELVQVVDYVYYEMFSWAMQLAKTRYTEYHYAKWMGKEGAREMIEIIQDDFENGSEIKVIAGKTLPVDNEFKFEQAQNDVEKGYISPIDYLEIAKYDNARELSQNAVLYQQNPMAAVGLQENQMPVPFTPGQLTPEQLAATQPPVPGEMPPEMTPPPNV